MRRLVPVVKAVRMSESVLQLSEQEVTRALAEIDAPELVAAELTGRGCGAVEDVRSAASGANLVVIVGVDAGALDIGAPRPGVLIVHAADGELPDAVLDAVDQVYVDDLRLLEGNGHRQVVRAHLADPPAEP